MNEMIISLHRPKNLISEQESREFMELFGQSAGLVEKANYGEITQAKKDSTFWQEIGREIPILRRLHTRL